MKLWQSIAGYLALWGGAVLVSLVLSLAGLALSLWVIVLVLQWTGVI